MTGSLFDEVEGEVVEDGRTVRLRRDMLAALEGPWPVGDGAIAEPGQGEKERFAEAFVEASRPRRFGE